MSKRNRSSREQAAAEPNHPKASLTPPPSGSLPASGSARWLCPLLVVLLAVGVYANTLRCGFTWDDQWLILDNTRLTDPAERVGYIKYMLFEKTLWRPLKRISLMADYAIWGRDRRGGGDGGVVAMLLHLVSGPGGFHATNTAFHAGACLALYFLALRLSSSRRLATLAALLFAVHPVHVEAVANISHRKEPMSLLFYLLGFLAYLRARPHSPGRVRFWAWLGLAMLAYLCGMLSKEVGAVMLPVTILVYELTVAPGSRQEKLKKLAVLSAPFVVVLLIFTFKGYLGTLPRRFSADQIDWITGSQTRSYGVVLLIVAKVFAIYADLLVWPLWPNALYLDRAFAIPFTVDATVLAGIGLFAAYVWGLVWSARKAPLACFALAWYGLNFLPISNLVPLTHWLLAERFLYVPSVGFSLLVALGLDALWRGRWKRLTPEISAQAAVALSAIVVIVHGGLTVRQNEVWLNSTTLWTHTLAHNEKSFRGLYGYGLELDNHGKKDEGEAYYRKTIAVEPSYPEAHYALALLLLNRHKYEPAIEEATLHSKLAPKDPEPYMIIGNARFGQRRYAEAVEAYAQAVKRSPKHVDAIFNLGNAYYAARQYPQALEAIDRALERKQDPDFMVLRGNILEQLSRPEDAVKTYRTAADLQTHDTDAVNALANLLVRLGRPEEALPEIERSLRLDPSQTKMKQLLERLGSSVTVAH